MTLVPGWIHRVDPGLVRTVMAARATLGLALAASALLPVAGSVSLTSAVLGMVVAFLAALLVDDEAPHAAVVSCAHVAAWSVLLVVLAAVLHDHRVATYVIFVGLMAVATWARGLGDRATAVGTTALVAYLMATFLQITASVLPELVASMLVAMALIAAMSGMLARRRCAWRDGQAVRALLVNGGAVARGARWERMGEAVSVAWERVGARRSRRDIEDRIRAHLVRVELLQDHLDLVRRGAVLPHGDPPIHEVRRRLREELDGLSRTWSRLSLGDRRAVGAPAAAVDDPLPTVARREAVQVAVAGTLAVVAGLSISEERWYWAAIAAFVVFVNTGHAGATVRKAIERTLGTGIGVVAGTWAATALAVRRWSWSSVSDSSSRRCGCSNSPTGS